VYDKFVTRFSGIDSSSPSEKVPQLKRFVTAYGAQGVISRCAATSKNGTVMAGGNVSEGLSPAQIYE